MERNRFRRALTSAILGVVVLGGCSESKTNIKPLTAPPATTIPSHATNLQEEQAYNLSLQAFNAYGEKLSAKHIGDIALGMCVGWEASKPGDITVVLNPGLAYASANNISVNQLVFSYMDTYQQVDGIPRSVLLNGPYGATMRFGNAMLEFGSLIETQPPIITFVETPNTTDPSISRHISAEPIRQPDGTWSFEDLESDLPVFDTFVTTGPLSDSRVLDVCNQIDPGYKTSGQPSSVS